MTDVRAPVPAPTANRGKAGWVAIAVTIVASFEGLSTVAYHDKIDPPKVNTVCYGHIEDVQLSDRYTKIQCQEMLADDLPRYDAMVKQCIHVPMPDHRHAALVSFTYNVGGGALCRSSVARYLNAGDVKRGCDALLLYNKSIGVVRKGLVRRREAERQLCLMDN